MSKGGILIFLSFLMVNANAEVRTSQSDYTLACHLATLLKKSYSSKVELTLRIDEALARIESLNKTHNRIDWFEKDVIERTSFFSAPRFQMLYHRYFGYEDFFSYVALIRDSKIDYESITSKMYEHGQHLNAEIRRGNHSSLPKEADYIAAIDSYVFPEDIKRGFKNTPFEPQFFGLGPNSDKLARWLLVQADNSVTYDLLLFKAFLLSSGDVVSALGMISSVLMTDAMTDRTYLAVISNKKLRMPEGHLWIKGKPGFHYHFWSYVALSFVRSSLNLRLRSFGYETLLTRDFEETKADQSGISLGAQAQELFNNEKLFSSVCLR